MKINWISILNNFSRSFLLFLLLVVVYILVKTYVIAPKPNTVSYTNNNFYVLDLNIPANLEFCGEKIPSNNYRIKKGLEKEFFNTSYWKNNSLALFQKAQRWFPYIEPILKQKGVPDDFKYLCVIESHLSNAASHAGAAGFWQLVPPSARNYGLEVNSEIDERYHVEKATVAACEHIKDAFRKFNNWTLAAAAYNRGIGGIQNAMAKQNADNYHDLLLNRETASFIYRIMAYKTLFSSPGHFGLKKKKLVYYSKIPFKTYKVDTTIKNIQAFAKQIGYSAETVHQFNPWLLTNELTNPNKKVYEIRVPKNSSIDYSGYTKDLTTHEGMKLQDVQEALITTTAITQKPDSIALTPPKKIVMYHVKVDEPLKNLATFLKVKEEDIRRWNKFDEKQQAVTGQTLIIKYPVLDLK
ncbi:lytic transglycosylase domain-containing protein [Aurantibacillus circumpalustris]|uniref:lytic transglycosylase domain-containing protein n=1 Tax=Aurantibacillus circumpalustris TaxID=3036359 RepID=UPI00295BFEC3|nr:transglycosylase SLT domain-containing protein [Aurantibacillus circumpalustris]